MLNGKGIATHKEIWSVIVEVAMSKNRVEKTKKEKKQHNFLSTVPLTTCDFHFLFFPF